MKPINDVTFLVVDCGLFLPLALRLAEQAKRVIWHNPDRRGFPSLRQACIGDGFEQLESTLDYWPLLPDVDCVVFPDIGNPGLQSHLEQMGMPVWGSRFGERLETGREYFLKRLGDLGLDVPKHEVIIGLDALRDHLREVEDVYIKVSRWRGDFETTHWRNWAMDSGWLDMEAVNFGPLKNSIHFLVFETIDTNLEIGGDTFCVDGQWPDLMLNGIEGKDKTFMAAVTKRGEMPEQIQEIMAALSPEFSHARYRNQFSMEVRVVDDASYFIDPTCRGGMPSSASQYRLWENFPEIVWAGANGELVEPEPRHMFSIECQLTAKCEKDTWITVELDPQLIEHCALSYCGFIDGCYVFPPDEIHHGELGWFVVTGNDPSELLQEAKDLADLLPDQLNADVESLSHVISEVADMQREGIPFTRKEMPEPSEVL